MKKNRNNVKGNSKSQSKISRLEEYYKCLFAGEY